MRIPAVGQSIRDICPRDSTVTWRGPSLGQVSVSPCTNAKEKLLWQNAAVRRHGEMGTSTCCGEITGAAATQQ